VIPARLFPEAMALPARPVLSRDQEAALIDVLREILKDEGEL